MAILALALFEMTVCRAVLCLFVYTLQPTHARTRAHTVESVDWQLTYQWGSQSATVYTSTKAIQKAGSLQHYWLT